MPRTYATYMQCLAFASACALGTPLARAAEDRPARVVIAPTPAQTAAAALAPQLFSDTRAGAQEPTDRSLFESPWFWAGVAGVVIAGVAIALLATQPEPDPPVPQGTLKLTVSVLTRDPCANAAERP